ncbi:endolytic transglycosylase MltG [Olsenella massiliensis]|uniref:endolytic transglycosylase MltG n=1 Tax=Olsenella massiliensis TaxID=1622075 RepID=UPI00071D00C0|nr:endolytic transglycosylase MltG [Olsenella massiliensis]
MADAQGRRPGRHAARPGGARRIDGGAPAAGTTRPARRVRRTQGRRPHDGGSRRRGSRLAPVVTLLLLLVVGAGVLIGVRHVLQGPPQPTGLQNAGQTVSVTIPSGASTADIARILCDAGVIADEASFKRAVSDQNAGTTMKSGDYDLVAGADVASIVAQLVQGPNSTAKRLAIAEGLTVRKTAEVVQASLGIPADDFLAQAKASRYASDYPFLSSAQDDSLEGYLYPKTYDFGGTTPTADSVIRAMLDQYASEVGSLDFAAAESQLAARYGVTVSDYDVIRLASIIEREALTDDDRTKIASVMYNRLRQGMYLQSDATMGYVTDGPVTAEVLKRESLYNTYLHPGFPPTPICAPSLASIKAALSPDDTNYLYFWITDSEHVFSETYEQHQKAIAAATGGEGADS